MMDEVRVGVIGSAFGSRVHIPGFMATPGYRVVAVCSARIERAEEAARQFDIPVALDDHRALVARDDVDLVSVSTPPRLHASMTLDALDAGKHVLCEKPFARSVSEAQAMVDAVRGTGLVHGVVHEMRFLPARRHLRQLVRSGIVGALRLVQWTVFSGYAVDPRMEPYWHTWVAERSEAGGVLNSLVSHHLDLARFTFGEIANVTGRAVTCIREKPVLGWDYRDGDPIGPETPAAGMRPSDADDTVLIQGDLDGGGLFSLNSSWAVHHGSGNRIEAYGSEGSLIVDEHGRVYLGRADEPQLVEIPLPEELVLPAVEGHPMVAPFAAMAADLQRAIRGDRAEPLYATFDDGLRVQEITETVLGPID